MGEQGWWWKRERGGVRGIGGARVVSPPNSSNASSKARPPGDTHMGLQQAHVVYTATSSVTPSLKGYI